MASIRYKDKTLDVDNNGYLIDQNEWNEEIAQQLAKLEGIDSLSVDQMNIITFLRQYYVKHKVFPILNNICRTAQQPKHCVNEQFINPEKAWKIAGLPKQDSVYFYTMDEKNYKMEQDC